MHESAKARKRESVKVNSDDDFRAFMPSCLRAKKNQRFFLSFGSNLGDKQKNIETAYEKIEKRIGNIVSVSAFYISDAVDFQSDNLFVNSVCEVDTDLDIRTIFASLQGIEKEIGRGEKSIDGVYSDRIIDIDILLADNLVIQSSELVIPHPKMHLREFVLVPMCEIAPDVVHSMLGKSMRELLEMMPSSISK